MTQKFFVRRDAPVFVARYVQWLASAMILCSCAIHHPSPLQSAGNSAPVANMAADADRYLLQPTVGPLPKVDRIVVEKSKRRLTLYHLGKPIKVYPISLGPHPVGRKTKEGDGKTPEGIYFLNWRNPQSRYFLAFHLSYPNKEDKETARELGVDPGGEIMLHGVGKLPAGIKSVKGVDWTNGCIAVSNEAMARIWSIVPEGTPIEIRP